MDVKPAAGLSNLFDYTRAGEPLLPAVRATGLGAARPEPWAIRKAARAGPAVRGSPSSTLRIWHREAAATKRHRSLALALAAGER